MSDYSSASLIVWTLDWYTGIAIYKAQIFLGRLLNLDKGKLKTNGDLR